MGQLNAWILCQRHHKALLFDADADGVVRTHVRGGRQRTLLRRHPDMEAMVVDEVESGLGRDDWEGLLYVMAWGDRVENLLPLYVGRTGRAGTKAAISANIRGLRRDKSKFARWGDGLDYHIGDLSHVVYPFPTRRKPKQKYERWAEMLFSTLEPPTLREPVNLLLVPWTTSSEGPSGGHVTLKELEEDVIDLALREYEDIVLNVQGETWWEPAASTKARPPDAATPTREVEYVTSADALETLCDELTKEPVIGLDVETTRWQQSLCLVQVSTRTFTAIIDPLALPNLEPLAHVFGRSPPLKVIHNASFERRVLGEHDMQIEGVYDTLTASRRLRPGKPAGGHGLAAVCKRELGLVLDKSQQLSNWSLRPLSPEQLDYAALDAEVLVDLHEALQRREGQGELGF